MKTRKKIAALILAAVMLLSLTACGTLDTKLAGAALKFSKLDCVHVDLEAVLDMSVNAPSMGFDMGIQMNADGSADYLKEPLSVAATLHASAMGEEFNVIAALEDVDGTAVLHYSLDNGETWESEELGDATDITESTGELELSDLLEFVEEVGDLISDFSVVGTETVNGAEAVRYDGYISGDAIAQYAAEAAAEELEDAGLDADELDFSNMADVLVSLWVDSESGQFVKAAIDMTDAVQSVIDSSMDALGEELTGEEGSDMTIALRQVSLALTFSSHNDPAGLGSLSAGISTKNSGADGAALSVGSVWVGTFEIAGHSGKGALEDGVYDVWAMLDTTSDGDLFFEIYDSADEDEDASPVLSFWAEIDGNKIVPDIGYEDAWLLNVYLEESDTDDLTFVLGEDGALRAVTFYYDSEEAEACDVLIELYPAE